MLNIPSENRRYHQLIGKCLINAVTVQVLSLAENRALGRIQVPDVWSASQKLGWGLGKFRVARPSFNCVGHVARNATPVAGV